MRVAFLVLAALMLSVQSQADEACSDLVQQAVQERVEKDFPMERMIVDRPDTSMVDGGSEYFVPVTAHHPTDMLLSATYSVLVGETCQVLGIERVR
jgi:hypothetical protein